MNYMGYDSQVWNFILFLPNVYVLSYPGLPSTVMSFVHVKGHRLREQMEPAVQLGPLSQVGKVASQRWADFLFHGMLIWMRDSGLLEDCILFPASLALCSAESWILLSENNVLYKWFSKCGVEILPGQWQKGEGARDCNTTAYKQTNTQNQWCCF